MYVNRFVQNAKRSKQKGAITVEELKKAEMQLYHWSKNDLHVNTLNKQISPKVGDDGIIRAHGRLETIKTLPREVRNSIVLPRNHSFSYSLL